MRFPIIRVYDKDTKTTHIIGSDVHDMLHIDENGAIQYLNLQCMCGTPETYEFVQNGEEDPFLGKSACRFVSIDTAKRLSEYKDCKDKENEAKLQKLLDIYFAKKKENGGAPE